jgi:hypothetical protein
MVSIVQGDRIIGSKVAVFSIVEFASSFYPLVVFGFVTGVDWANDV